MTLSAGSRHEGDLAAYGAYHRPWPGRGHGRRRTPAAILGRHHRPDHDGKTQVLDGPYAETKEQLGGYYVIEAPDLDAALSWAERCPGAAHG